MKRIFLSNSREETQAPSTSFARSIKAGAIFALYGDLGSGKTTFVQGVAKALGIKQSVTSPTFVLMKSYKINKPSIIKRKIKKITHIDCYRISKAGDAEGLGLEEVLSDPKSIVFIEWPERIKDLLPKKIIKILFTHLGGDKRKIEVEI